MTSEEDFDENQLWVAHLQIGTITFWIVNLNVISSFSEVEESVVKYSQSNKHDFISYQEIGQIMETCITSDMSCTLLLLHWSSFHCGMSDQHAANSALLEGQSPVNGSLIHSLIIVFSSTFKPQSKLFQGSSSKVDDILPLLHCSKGYSSQWIWNYDLISCIYSGLPLYNLCGEGSGSLQTWFQGKCLFII